MTVDSEPMSNSVHHHHQRPEVRHRVFLIFASFIAITFLGMLFPFWGPLVVAAALCFTVLRKVGIARWWLLAYGALNSLGLFYTMTSVTTLWTS